MKTLLFVLLLAGCAFAQAPKKTVRRDSLPEVFPNDFMPIARPYNSFYRSPKDPENVVRATLDNMPVKVPDSSTHYTMLRSYQRHRKPIEPPARSLKPIPPVLPKRFE